MSTTPPQKVQAEALDLPLEERVRLAYRLLESLDKSLEKGAIKDPAAEAAPPAVEETVVRDDELQTGRAKATAAPQAPDPKPAPKPAYTVRFDDGSGVAIPVKFSVRDSDRQRQQPPSKQSAVAPASPIVEEVAASAHTVQDVAPAPQDVQATYAAPPVAEATPAPPIAQAESPQAPSVAPTATEAVAPVLAANTLATAADLPAPDEVAAILDRIAPLNPASAQTRAPLRPSRAQTQPHQPAQSQQAAPPSYPAPSHQQPAPAQWPQPPQSYSAPVQQQPAAAQRPQSPLQAAPSTRALDLTPEPLAEGALVKASDRSPEPFVPWELIPADTSADLPAQGPVIGVGLTFPGWKRTGIVVTSLVGGVGAMAAAGLILQGRQSSPDDYLLPAATVTAPVSAPVSAPVVEAPAPSEPEPLRAEPRSQTQAPAPSQPAQTERAPAAETPRAPALVIPTLPSFTESLVIRDIAVPPTSIDAPSVRLPAASAASAGLPDATNQRTQPPQVRNQSRVQQALERAYPIGLREVGIGGRVELAFYINEQGAVERYEIRESSGNAALDQAALRVAPVFEFTPAQRGNSRIAGWFSRGITFGQVVSTSAMTAVAPPEEPASGGPNQPTATQFDQPPQIRNATQVRQALEREYPIGLRATGVGGRVEIWFYVNDKGVVERSQLRRTSGTAALDQAALRVAQVFQFNPGRRGDAPIPGWISIPIVFDANSPDPDSGIPEITFDLPE